MSATRRMGEYDEPEVSGMSIRQEGPTKQECDILYSEYQRLRNVYRLNKTPANLAAYKTAKRAYYKRCLPGRMTKTTPSLKRESGMLSLPTYGGRKTRKSRGRGARRSRKVGGTRRVGRKVGGTRRGGRRAGRKSSRRSTRRRR